MDIYDSSLDYRILGDNIKKYRRLKNMTQAQLAEKSKISEKYVSKIENARHKLHSHVLIDIANALQVSIYDLIGVQLSYDNSVDYFLLELISRLDNQQKRFAIQFLEFLKNYNN